MKFVMITMMKYLILALTTFLFFPGSSEAQMVGGVKFDKIDHDFGTIKEEIGIATALFEFTNVGTGPLYINKIETSCGCTKPEYSKDTIMPGGKGFIKALYETRGRSGDFHKNLFVYFNTMDHYQSLSIAGTVIPEANLSKRPAEYNTTYSSLALTSTIASFPNIKSTEKQTVTIKAFNYQGYPIKIWEVGELPDYVSLDIGDSTLDVMDSLFFKFTVDATKIASLGEMRLRVSLLTDDAAGELKFLHMYLNVKEDFSKLTKEQLKNAPKIVLDSTGALNYGKCIAGGIVSKNITITNDGKTDLKIRNVKPSCSCVSFKLPKQILKPGESVTFTIIIDTVNQTIAGHTKYITLYTNDPKKSEISIKLIINITSS